MRIEAWGPQRLGELVGLLDASMPDERFGDDDLRALLWDDPDPAVVLGEADGRGAIAVVARPGAGHLRLLAVAPGERLHGIGRTLVAAGEEWLRAKGAASVTTGGEAPFYVWPGVDERAEAVRALLAGVGYRVVGASPNASCP